jgi:hypothetical protein
MTIKTLTVHLDYYVKSNKRLPAFDFFDFGKKTQPVTESSAQTMLNAS